MDRTRSASERPTFHVQFRRLLALRVRIACGVLAVGLAVGVGLAAPLQYQADQAGTIYLGAIAGQD